MTGATETCPDSHTVLIDLGSSTGDVASSLSWPFVYAPTGGAGSVTAVYSSTSTTGVTTTSSPRTDTFTGAGASRNVVLTSHGFGTFDAATLTVPYSFTSEAPGYATSQVVITLDAVGGLTFDCDALPGVVTYQTGSGAAVTADITPTCDGSVLTIDVAGTFPAGTSFTVNWPVVYATGTGSAILNPTLSVVDAATGIRHDSAALTDEFAGA